MSKKRQAVIGAFLATNNAFHRQVLQGMSESTPAGTRVIWLPEGDRFSPDLATLGLSAAVITFNSVGSMQMLNRLRIPMVNIGSVFGCQATVYLDNHRLGREAAAVLQRHGCRATAFIGTTNGYSRSRARALAAETVARGMRWLGEAPTGIAGLQQFLLNLPPATGILAVNDLFGVRVLQLCRASGIPVPERLRVVAVDDDELLCSLCEPPLASFRLPGIEVGVQVMAILARLLAGKSAGKTPGMSPLLPIGPLQWRASLGKVVDNHAFMPESLTDLHSVSELAQVAGVGRRTIERRWRREYATTPYQTVLQARLNRAEHLLLTTTLSVLAIAGRVGFASSQRLAAHFHRRHGLSPGRWRLQQQDAQESS